MKIETIPHPSWAKVLTEDMLRSFFVYDPRCQASFTHRARQISRLYDANRRKQLVETMCQFHKPELLHPHVVHNLTRLGFEESLVVIGGQQAGMLTGPLYTIYKAISLIQLAQREEKQLGRPVIPVFWIAGEDHDRDEVDHIWVQNTNGFPTKSRFQHPELRKCSIAKLLLTPKELHRWLDELASLLPDSAYKKEWILILKELSAETISWTRYFARIMHQLFGKWGLLLIDAADPQLRHLEIPFFQQIIAKNGQIQQSVLAASAKWKAIHGTEPVAMKEFQANLFIEVDGERESLSYQAGKWTSKNQKLHCTTKALLTQLELAPERFSNNVITRPFMQEYLFPTLAFVGGPSEIAYWSILREAFPIMELEMPIVYPRSHFTILDRTVQKRIKAFGLSWEDLFTRLEQKQTEWLQTPHSLDLERWFQQVKEQIMQITHPVIQRLEQEIGMDLKAMGQKNQQKLLEQVDFFYAYTQRQIATKYQTELRHWQEIKHQVWPREKLQERVYNFVDLWNRYGLCWVDELLTQGGLHLGEAGAHDGVRM
jgi:bacillithiol synthase